MKALNFLKKEPVGRFKPFIFVGSIFLFISGCLQTGLEELVFFEVEINKKSWTTDYGTILLNGNISGPADGELEDHGFIWSTNSEEINLGSLIPNQTISRGPKNDADAFTANFTFPDPTGTYFFRAFAKKRERLVFFKQN